MQKGTVLFIEDSDFIPGKTGKTELSIVDIAQKTRDEILKADLVIYDNKIIKHRYANRGDILSNIDYKGGPLNKYDICCIEKNEAIIRKISKNDEDILNKRAEEILEIILKCFDLELLKQHFAKKNTPYGNKCRVCSNLPSEDNGEVSWNLFSSTDISKCIETIFWDYNQGFPKMFLYMKNEEIESYILNEIKAHKEKRKIEEEKNLEKINSDMAKIKSALSKLNNEEKALLGIKF